LVDEAEAERKPLELGGEVEAISAAESVNAGTGAAFIRIHTSILDVRRDK
jgi:hypothetical protein